MSGVFNRLRGGVNRALGVDLRSEFRGVHEELAQLRRELDARTESLAVDIERANRALTVQTDRARVERDDIPSLRRALEEFRGSDAYRAAFAETEPLVTVRMPAWRKTEELVDVAIASVLRQTYQRFEIVVVNDGPNEKTGAAIEALGDPRIRYVEFPEQNRYPRDKHSRWQVAGAPGMNRGVELARGTWIAPLDDDDEFTEDHLAKLVALALEKQAELAYGALVSRNSVDGTERLIWSDPPAISEFSFLGALYLRGLPVEFDAQSWMVDEPADWNLIRRMVDAGVRFASTRDVVGTIHLVPYTAKSDE